MTLLVQELSKYQQARIAPDEQVLWCGKGRPVAWFNGAVGQCIMGFLLLIALSFFGSNLIPIITYSEAGSLIGKAEVVAFYAVPGLICISLLFAPLWHWCATRRAVWVITNRRVLRFYGRSFREWKDSGLLDQPERKVLDDGGCDFVFGQQLVSSKSSSRMVRDSIESVPPEDVARVEAALVRLAECRKAEEAVALPGLIAGVSERFTVLHSPDGSVRIIYRKNRPILGAVMLTVTVGFIVLMTVLVHAGNMPIPVYFLFVPIPVLACYPFLYNIIGRREISLAAGFGKYFNGIGRIGFSRVFSYNSHSRIQEGRTVYQINGRNHFSVMLHESEQKKSRMILAHGEEAVAKEFIRHLKSVFRQQCAR